MQQPKWQRKVQIRRRQRRRQRFGVNPLLKLSVLSLLAFLCYLDVLVVSAADIICAKGWGGDDDVGVAIPTDWMNDGYCDCPLDGLDEPNTNACSGSKIGGWAGTGFASTNLNSPSYQCPGQPKKKIPISRINDGVCDCCDGSDEKHTTSDTSCPDICDEVLAAERAEREKMEKEFRVGHEQRQKQVLHFEELVKTTHQKINGIHEELSETNKNLSYVSVQIKAWKSRFLQERLDRVNYILSNNKELYALLEPLTNDELASLIIHGCQMAGEMDGVEVKSSSEKTCAPLRLAGLDVAIMWEDEDLETGSKVELTRWNTDSTRLSMLSQIMHWNVNVDDEMVWNRKGFSKFTNGKGKKRKSSQEASNG